MSSLSLESLDRHRRLFTCFSFGCARSCRIFVCIQKKHIQTDTHSIYLSLTLSLSPFNRPLRLLVIILLPFHIIYNMYLYVKKNFDREMKQRDREKLGKEQNTIVSLLLFPNYDDKRVYYIYYYN